MKTPSHISDNGISFLESLQVYKTTAYQGADNIWIIGYGHTGAEVVKGLSITRQQATAYLKSDIAKVESVVSQSLKNPINQNQFDALVIFAYNIGLAAFSNSMVVKMINAGNYAAVQYWMAKWNTVNGVFSQGLQNERTAEIGLWNTSDTSNSALNESSISLSDTDKVFKNLYLSGSLDSASWDDYTVWSATQLIAQAFIPKPAYNATNLSPIGAFYEGTSAIPDSLASIASKTFRILDSSGAGLSAAQLITRDANGDGELSGAELNGLFAWRDLNEDGVLNQSTPEWSTLSAALTAVGLSSVRASDYIFYTAGNANYRTMASLTVPVAAASNYNTLRNTDNHCLYINNGQSIWIDWLPTQIKLSSDQQSMVGTDGNDNFNINFYSGSILNLSQVQNFYAGAGNDMMGGSIRSDNLWGGTGDDSLFGYAGDDRLYGEDGNDVAQGAEGNDVMDGGAGADRLFGQVGNDILAGGDGNDALMGFTAINDVKQTLAQGETDNDILFGGNGDDQLYGGLGDDILDGGDGNDIILGGTTLYDAALVVGVSDNNFLDGGAGNDQLYGSAGNDYLDGGAGIDYMHGGKGNDTYIVNSIRDAICELLDDGYDTVIAGTSYVLNMNIEELRLTEGGAYNGTGNSLDNRITGNSQDNILDGVTGADTMSGGQGNDTYYVDNVGDQVVELVGEGSDTVNAKISYTLAANVENLALLDFSQAQQGVANGVNILVYGYPKALELDYSQGNGVAGYLGTCALTAIANLATQANQMLTEAQVVQTAIDNQWCTTDASLPDGVRGGSNLSDQQALLDYYHIRHGVNMGYHEDAIANLIMAGHGVIISVNSSRLWGSSASAENGVIDHVVTVTGVACDAVTGALNGFYIDDSGREQISDMTRYLSLADFRAAANVLGAYALYTTDAVKLWDENINATGNALDNIIHGNRGNNVLNGGQGNDTLIGGDGDDSYVVDNAGDVVVENVNEGNDTVQASISYALGANVENLILTGGAAINGSGNMQNNTLTGNAASNLLDGGVGADVMAGGAGNDTYVVDNIGDVVVENANEGSDTVQASISYVLGANVENLILTGGAGINGSGNAQNNILTGNTAHNVLDGGVGADTMAGGGGNDTYVVDDIGDVVVENVNQGSDTVQASISYTLGANVENLILTGGAAINGSGNAQNNTLTGNAANNVLDGGVGNDLLAGGAGNDTYLFARNAGSDIIQENDATLGNLDVLQMGTNIAQQNLWFSHIGNDLRIAVMGTNAQVTVSNWYSGSQYQIERIKTADGRTMYNTDVENMVQAMAALAAPTSAQTSWTSGQMASNGLVLLTVTH